MADATKKCGLTEAKVRWTPETLEAAIRERVRDTIEAVLEQELEAALGAEPSARVDEAILGVYLAGGNRRRIRGALAPLLRGGPLSKDAVSRLVGRLAEEFATWRQRDLADDQIRYLLLDGWYPKVRLGKRRVRVPVLVTMGVRADGQRVVVDMRLVGDESTAAWRDVVQQLQARHVGTPVLAVIDGNPGLATAWREAWPTIGIERCPAHQLRNLRAKAPARVRTTNALERINEEFRRRTTTQASLPSQDAVLLLLFGLLRAGHIRVRKIDGRQERPQVTAGAAAAQAVRVRRRMARSDFSTT